MSDKSRDSEIRVKVKDASKAAVNDSIQYTLKLKPGPYADLMDEAKRALLVDITKKFNRGKKIDLILEY